MADRTWNSSGSTDANLATNYTGSGALLSTDVLIFDSTSSVNAANTATMNVGRIELRAGYGGGFTAINQAITINSGVTLSAGTFTANSGSSFVFASGATDFTIGSGVTLVGTTMSFTINGTGVAVTNNQSGTIVSRSINFGNNASATISGTAPMWTFSGAFCYTLGTNASITNNIPMTFRCNTAAAIGTFGAGSVWYGTGNVTFGVQAAVAATMPAITYRGSGAIDFRNTANIVGSITMTGAIDLGSAQCTLYGAGTGTCSYSMGSYAHKFGVFKTGTSAAGATLSVDMQSCTPTCTEYDGDSLDIGTCSLAFGTSQWTVSGNVFTMGGATTYTGQTTGQVTFTTGSTCVVTCNDKSMPTLIASGNTTIYTTTAATVQALKFGTDGKTICLNAGKTWTLSTLAAADWNGTAGSLNYLQSCTPGSVTTIALPNAATCTYMQVTDVTATGYTVTVNDGTSLPGGGTTGFDFGGIAITDFGDHQVFQRRKDGTHNFESTTAPIIFAGTFTGAFSKVQYRVTNHSTAAVIADWADLDTAPNGGYFSTYANSIPQSTGPIWYKGHVRAVASNGVVIATSSGSNKWGIGVNIVIRGQSNAAGYGALSAPRNSLTDFAGMFTGGSWKLLTDPCDYGGIAGASLAPKMVKDLCDTLLVPVGVMNVAEGSKGLVGADGSYYYSVRTPEDYPANNNNLYGQNLVKYNLSKMHASWMVWYQGERDSNVVEDVTEAEYLSAIKEQIDYTRQDYAKSLKWILVGLGRRPTASPDVTDASLSAIQMAIIKACNNSDVFYCPAWDLPLGGDNTHVTTAGHDNTLGPRIAKMIASNGSTRSAVLQSATATAARTVRLIFAGGSGLSSATNTCFKIRTSGDVDKTDTATLIDPSTVDIATTSDIAAGDYLALGYGIEPDVTTVPVDANGFCVQNYPEKATLPVSAISTSPANIISPTTSIANMFTGTNSFLFAPTAWGRGDGKSDKHTGTVPITGGVVGTLNNCSNAADGYIYSASGSYFSGNNARVTEILTNNTTQLTDASRNTWAFKCRWKPHIGVLIGAVNSDGVNEFYIGLIQNGLTGYILVIYKTAVGSRQTSTVTTFLPSYQKDISVIVTKDGATFRVYVDNTEATYAVQNSYDHGNLNMVATNNIGNYNHPSTDYAFENKLYAAGYSSTYMTMAERREWFDAQNHLQLYGYSDGTLLTSAKFSGSTGKFGGFKNPFSKSSFSRGAYRK